MYNSSNLTDEPCYASFHWKMNFKVFGQPSLNRPIGNAILINTSIQKNPISTRKIDITESSLRQSFPFTNEKIIGMKKWFSQQKVFDLKSRKFSFFTNIFSIIDLLFLASVKFSVLNQK